MRRTLLTAALGLLIIAATLGAGLASAPAAAQSPVPSGTPTSVPTAAPPPGPSYKGRACTVGRLIHDFLIVQEPPPGPRATCSEPVTNSAPEALYRLRSVPEGLRFDRILRGMTPMASFTSCTPPRATRRMRR